jgi:tetratricopeptide (TPR) repeat protein/transcriptional regulator with XRE-family HTH domain
VVNQFGVNGTGNFGALLRASRRAAGLSQQELAEQSGLSVRAVGDLERGHTRWPYPDSVRRLADALALDEAARTQFVATAGRRLADLATADDQKQPPEAIIPPIIPHQLPAPPRHFVSRDTELSALTRQLDSIATTDLPTMVISAIGGTAGVGKSALAVHWAHQVADRFPDGQLYVNLRGYDIDRPMTPEEALGGFLRALGMSGAEIPPGVEERAAAYRSRIADLRILVVLDNARQAEQVRPLLPGTPSCAVLVTSRDAMAGLVARDGATRVELDLLSQRASVELLRELIGTRALADPSAAATMATRCCRLPLALRVAAELTALRPDDPLAVLAAELVDVQHRLDVLDAGGDEQTAVRAVFSWSYRYLDPAAARAFRMIGLHPGSDFDAYALAASTGTGHQEATRLLGRLARAHLVQPVTPGRYGLHDLLREYARELAAYDGQAQRHASLTGLLDYYLYTCATAVDTMDPADSAQRPHIPPPNCPVPPVTDPPAAAAWLNTELPGLVVLVSFAADHGWPDHATRLSATLFRHLDSGGHYAEAAAVHEAARRAAARSGDHSAEAAALSNLGLVDWRLSRYQAAADHFSQSLALARQAGDTAREARTLANLGLVDLRRGRYRAAAGHLRQSLPLFRANGDLSGQARTVANLGGVELRLGRYHQAAELFRRSQDLYQKTGDRFGEIYSLANLGFVDLMIGDYPEAIAKLTRARSEFREAGDRSGEVDALIRLGRVAHRQGLRLQAADYLNEALAYSREAGHLDAEAETLNDLGDIALTDGQPHQAATHHANALALAARIADEYEQARAHHGLAHAHHAMAETALADRHQKEALRRFTLLGTPEAAQIRAERAAAAERDRL